MKTLFAKSEVLTTTTILVALLAGACGSKAPTGPGNTPATIALSASPNPMAGALCTGCGTGSTDRESKTTVTVKESAGVAGTITSIDMVLRANAGSTIIAQGSFDSAGVTSLAGTARVAANGSLNVLCGVHYAASAAGQAATLTYTVRFTDDHGNALTQVIAVPVSAT